MTATLAPDAPTKRSGRALPPRTDSESGRVASATPLPPLAPRLQLVRATLLMASGLALCLVLHLLVLSPLQQRAAQQRTYDALRSDLAAGTAPVSATGAEVGTPIAYLEIPAIGLRQVVVEGTTGGALATGPGHRRDTAFPGLAGTSVVMGRRATFGGPFARLDELEPGAVVSVTTGAGVAEYRVRGVRRSGEPAPAPVASGSGRLVLATSDGSPFFPTGVLLVDADLAVPPLGAAQPSVAAGVLPAAERPMAVDSSTLWRLVLWLQALLVVLVAAIWCWHRWDPARTWIVALPPVALIGSMAASEAARLLPNLL